MKFLLKTSYPCLIKTDTEQIELEENDSLEIVDEQFIFIYPQNSNLSPFYINLQNPIENSSFSIIKKEEKNLIFLETQNKIKISQKNNLSFSGKNYHILVNDHSVIFESEQKKLEVEKQDLGKNYKIQKIKNFACVEFEHDFYAFNLDNHKLFHFCGDNIEINQDKLTIIKKYHDSLGREKKTTYTLDKEISIENEEIMQNLPQQTRSRELLGYKFLEAIKAKDFNYCYKTLSPKLQASVPEEQLGEFFGNVSAFLPLNTTEFITISSQNKQYVKFSIIDDVIDDITVDSL